MFDINSKSIYQTVVARILVWGALAIGAPAIPLYAQDTIAGNFKLNENARFGDTVLAAGQYRFSIEAVGTIQSIRSIQQGAGHLVLVVVRPENSGPAASIFAMASVSRSEHRTSELILEPEKEQALVRAMHLEKEGLEVTFDWANTKVKTPVIAQESGPQQSTAAANTGGTE
jgi:hypothetical protein